MKRGGEADLQLALVLWLGAQDHRHLRGQEDVRDNLLEEAAAALSLGEAPHKEELALLQESKNMQLPRHDGAESDQGGAGRRRVGADEKWSSTLVVNVSPADDEQDASLPETGEQGKKRAQAG